MLDNSDYFLNKDSMSMTAHAVAEWNQNMYNQPYVVISGNGTTSNFTGSLGSDISGEYKKENFVTKSFAISSSPSTSTTSPTMSYAPSGGIGAGKSLKVVFFAKTNSSYPVVLNAYISGIEAKASRSYEIDNLVWTKYEMYVGWSSLTSETSLSLKLTATVTGSSTSPIVYFTLPEIYSITNFDYEHGSLWSAYSPFKGFRPGESYVPIGYGVTDFAGGSRYIDRSVTKNLLGGYGVVQQSMPISPIIYNPSFFFAYPPVSVYKPALATDINPYQYFLSSKTSGEKILTAKYEKSIVANKLVLKFNAIASIPTVNIYINSILVVSGVSSDLVGMLTVYYDGSGWSTNPFTSPTIQDSTSLSLTPAAITSISIEQISSRRNIDDYTSNFPSDLYASKQSELERMHLIEVSPRLEIDLSNRIKNIEVNKSLDSLQQYVPISSVNSNDVSITFSSIPDDGISPSTFSNKSVLNGNILFDLLKKGVKIVTGYTSKSQDSSPIYTPAGTFYTESWTENDISDVSVQAYDITRYLQTTPAPDYVANTKKVFDIITNILDLSGFTDYDYDSLYAVCNNATTPMDFAYYYVNSQDSTILDALSKIFLAYQIGAFIDERGIMKFLSLSSIINNKTSTLDISEYEIVADGYSFESKSKPGKLSLRYQQPIVKQSLSLQNVKDINQSKTPSFIFTTSNDVVWSQESLDSIGFNYLSNDFLSSSNLFSMNKSDLLNIFHTYSLNAGGYAVIESEVVSFENKEYTIAKYTNPSIYKTVSVKDDRQLSAAINDFIREDSITLRTTNVKTVSAATGNGTQITYTSTAHGFSEGDFVSVSGINPSVLNQSAAKIVSASTNTFTVYGNSKATYVSGGSAYIKTDYDVSITPTGNITSTRRGIFNTKISDHKMLGSSLTNKSLSTFGSSGSVSTSNNKISVTGGTLSGNTYTFDSNYIYPTSDRDFGNRSQPDVASSNNLYLGYQTYVTKFEFIKNARQEFNKTGVFGIFFNSSSASATNDGTHFIEIRKDYTSVSGTGSTSNPFIYQYKYGCFVYNNTSGQNTLIAYSDITGLMNSIENQSPVILVEKPSTNPIQYEKDMSNTFPFTLRVSHSPVLDNEISNSSQSETTHRSLRVFINGIEVTSWQISNSLSSDTATVTNAVFSPSSYQSGYMTYYIDNSAGIFNPGDQISVSGITPSEYNSSGTVISSDTSSVTIFTYFSSSQAYSSGGTLSKATDAGMFSPIGKNIDGIRYPITFASSLLINNSYYGAYGGGPRSSIYSSSQALSIFPNANHIEGTGTIGYISEIYATQSALKESGINYFYQDRRFLNRAIQGQNTLEKTYHMQTKPEVVGLRSYDVQYSTPAAINVDVLPIEYSWYYFPGENLEHQQWYQKLDVTETALSYSTPINTGFRARMLIANASPHMVYLTHDADQLNQFTTRLNLWTHEIIAATEQQIIEKVLDGNSSEVAQIDSEWIQSRNAANKILSTIGAGIDGFSNITTIKIYGNPTIQVGDVVSLFYPAKGINGQKCVVHSVNNSFDGGLSTTLTMFTVERGASYSEPDNYIPLALTFNAN